MGLFGRSDSDEEEKDTDLDNHHTSTIDSYVSDRASKKSDSLSVDERVENAWSETVTKQKLTKQSFDESLGEHTILSEKSLSEFLNATEQPHFIFHAKGKPPRKNGEKFLKPHHSGGLTGCFTDKRVILVAGMKNDNATEEIAYSNLQNYETNTGRMKHRISLETKDLEYDIYISNYYGMDDLKTLSDFLDDVISAPDNKSKKTDTISKKVEGTDTQQDVSDTHKNDSEEESDTIPDSHSRQDSIPNSLQNRAKRIGKESDSRTVTKPRLIYTKNDVTNDRQDAGFTNTPIVSHLEEDDEVWYILTDKKGGVKTDEWTKEPHTSGQTAFVFTDSRILAIVPGEKDDEVVKIKYNKMVSYSNTKDIRFKSQDPRFGVSYAELRVRTEDDTPYILRILPKYSDECEEWIERVRNKIHDDYVHVLLSAGTGRITLEILDRETGEAKMETSGWNYGLGFVERHTSSSKIEKEGYETYATDFVATENGIQVTYEQVEGESVAMQRTYDEIGAVDMTGSGFIIYASSGIYKFSHRYVSDWGNSLGIDADRMKEVGEFIRSKVNEAKSEQSHSGEKDTQDNIEKLERLANLKDEGVLTEEEFEEKKQDLLDGI
jgi:hypothetical protein